MNELHGIDHNEDVTRDVTQTVSRNSSKEPITKFTPHIANSSNKETAQLLEKYTPKNISPIHNIHRVDLNEGKTTYQSTTEVNKRNHSLLTNQCRASDIIPNQNKIIKKISNQYNGEISRDKNNISSELDNLVGRISGNLTRPLSCEAKPLYSEKSIVRPHMVTPLTSSVEDLQIPSYQSSVQSNTVPKEISRGYLKEESNKNLKSTDIKFDIFCEREKKKAGEINSSTINIQMTTLNYLLAELRNLVGDKGRNMQLKNLCVEIEDYQFPLT